MFLEHPDESKLKEITLDDFEIQLMELVRHGQLERLSEKDRKVYDSPNSPTKGRETSRND